MRKRGRGTARDNLYSFCPRKEEKVKAVSRKDESLIFTRKTNLLFLAKRKKFSLLKYGTCPLPAYFCSNAFYCTLLPKARYRSETRWQEQGGHRESIAICKYFLWRKEEEEESASVHRVARHHGRPNSYKMHAGCRPPPNAMISEKSAGQGLPPNHCF